MESIEFLVWTLGWAWLIFRPMDTFYKARLIEAAASNPRVGSLVNRLLNNPNLTCLQAAVFLKRMDSIRDNYRATSEAMTE